VSEPPDGKWEPPTEHDNGALTGEDPPTRPATLAEAVRARAASRRPNVHTEPTREQVTIPKVHTDPTREQKVVPKDDVVLLDMVSRNAPTSHAPPRNDTAAGSIVVVATGAEAQRVRTLCQVAALDVPIVASLGVVHDAASVIVIGEPSPPAPSRVVHIARPSLSDDMLLALLRALTTSRAVADPPEATGDDPRVRELAEALAAQTDHAAIERIGVEAILALADADRAQLLFHDPSSGALWSETVQRANGDARRAIAGIAGWAAHTGHAVIASPAGDDPRYLLDVDDPDGKPQARLFVQPVICGDRRVHALLVAARRWRRTDFTDAERARLTAFAATIAPALDTAGLTGPARAKRSTLSGVTTGMAAAAPADLSPGATMTLPQQAELRLPALPSTPADAPSPAMTMQMPPQSELRPPATSSPPPADSAQVSPAPVQTSPTVRSLPPMPAKPSPAESAQMKRPSVEDSRLRRESVEPRSKRPSTEESDRRSRDGIEPRDVAVIATDPVDIARVGKLAKKARLEVSVLSSTEEVPPYYRIVTIGEAWTPDSDARVAYAARIEITDDQLIELLSGIASERAAAPLVLQKPQSIAEARRLEPAFANLRAIATGADLAVAETTMVATTKQLLDADRAYCFYFDASTGSLWSESRERNAHDDRKAIAGVVGWAARTGRAVHVERASADPRWLGPLDDPEGDPNSQLLVQPVITADRRVIGVLVAVRRPKRPGFTDVDASLLAQLAALASPLLEQLELADDCAQLLRDSSAPVRAPIARSSLQRPLPRAA